jgi:hypothetical protein
MYFYFTNVCLMNFLNVLPLNNGQNFGDQECLLLRGFTVSNNSETSQ